MTGHARFSPSSAERWFACPGSVPLSEGMPGQASAYADEGTRAHTLAEALLEGEALPQHTPEMLRDVQVYVDHVRSLAVSRTSALHVEKRVIAEADVWGTADAIVWDPEFSTLYVRDLKYGAGVPVEVSDNLQLKIYALAALRTMGYRAKLVNVGIVQPRIPHPDGLIRSKDYDAVDLIDFHADLLEAVDRVREAERWHGTMPEAEWIEACLHPTEKGCRWCHAAPVCPRVKAMAQESARRVFAPAAPYDAKELADTLDQLPILEAWCKNVREFAYREAERGIDIPRYKLVAKTPTRKWKPGIAGILATTLGVNVTELFGVAPMKGVGEIQKLAQGRNDAERAAVLEPFVTKESSGHTLAHESDNRPAVRLDAAAAFSGV